MISLSASRIKTFKSCSWTYYCKYVLKLPDTTNVGAQKGTICHAVFETLSNPRHLKTFETVVKHDSVFSSPSLNRYVKILCRKVGIDSEEDYQDIDDMCMRGLTYEFFGQSKKDGFENVDAKSEEKFDFTIEENGKRYRILGFIDKMFWYPNSKMVYFRDFKTSKEVFKGEDASNNIQYAIYSLAAKHIYPQAEKIAGEFLFLRFPKNTTHFCMKVKPISKTEIEGLEYELTDIQEQMENFTIDDAVANLAAKMDYPSDGSFSGPLSCGRAKTPKDLKKDGTKMWHCPFKFSFFYYEITDQQGVLVKNVFEDDFPKIVLKEGQKASYKKYKGCPAWNGGKTS